MLNAKTLETIDDNCLKKIEQEGPMAIEEFLAKC